MTKSSSSGGNVLQSLFDLQQTKRLSVSGSSKSFTSTSPSIRIEVNVVGHLLKECDNSAEEMFFKAISLTLEGTKSKVLKTFK